MFKKGSSSEGGFTELQSSCRAWRAIASDDRLWGLLWQKDMGRGSCWRWARAAGGFREMLRAKTVVRRGRHTQANFPFDHRDGVVQEVLMLDGPNPMVITTQFKRPPSQAVRLAGITIKVWDARALAAQAPLLVVYDVLKHMQMEDGSLFLWAIEGDQIVDTGIPDGATGYISRMGPSPQHPWAENEHIKPYRLDAADQRLMEVPLASRFGQGTAQHEWFDLARGCVASIQLMQAEQVIRMRLYSLATGRCFKESSVSLDLPGVPRFELPDHDGMLLMNRTMAAVPNVIVTCALFDHRVFRWELQDEWFTPEYQARVAEAGLEAGQAGPDGTPGPHELRLMFVAPENEPVVELGISTDSHRIIVLAAEHLFLFNLAGTPLCFYDTQAWCGPDIPPATHAVDLGAFVWPLPHSERLVVYMERSHSVYVVDSQLPAVGRPSTDCLTPPHWQHASPPTDTFAACVYTLQSHEDLRTPKHAYGASAMGFLMTGRMRGNVIEAVIVEHTECGHVMFTSACTAAPPVAALLQRDALQDPSNAGKGKKSAAKEQWRNANKWGASWKRRALVAIDTATGQRFKAVVFDGCIESEARPVMGA
ncbi:hypothetical protein WJX72_011802 [[Myrmecia] bisecta]|uniref:F-box domain-containing protein n=1 Tax=[Myrmecia] bisecta TaxID=41462 RepID=A0AAW1Q8E0_9CHLO